VYASLNGFRSALISVLCSLPLAVTMTGIWVGVVGLTKILSILPKPSLATPCAQFGAALVRYGARVRNTLNHARPYQCPSDRNQTV